MSALDPIFDETEMTYDQRERCARCHGVLDETDRALVIGGLMHDDCVRRLIEGDLR